MATMCLLHFYQIVQNTYKEKQEYKNFENSKFWFPKIQNNKTPYLLDFQRKKIRQVFFILVLFRFLRSTLVCGELANRYDDWLYSIY